MTKMIHFHYPNEKTLAVVGAITIRHEQMTYATKMFAKTLLNIEPQEALLAFGHEGPDQIRERVRRIAKNEFGEGAVYMKLQALLANGRRLSKKRNELLHGLWAQTEGDSQSHIRASDGSTAPIPSYDQLTEFATELSRFTTHLLEIRLHGFIAEAMAEKKKSVQKKKTK